MAIVKIGNKAVNMDAVTFVEDTTELDWPTAQAPKAEVPIVRVHFVGGTATKFFGRDIAEARRVFGLVLTEPAAVNWVSSTMAEVR